MNEESAAATPSEKDVTIFQMRKDQISLLGRESETKLLLDAYKRVRDSPASELALIHGESGAGKNALIQHLKEYSGRISESTGRGSTTAEEAYFCEAKFDQIAYTGPYAVIMEACNQLCEQFLESEDLVDIRAKILKTLGPETRVLSQVMSGFKKLAGIGPDDEKEQSMRRLSQGLPRLKVVCRSFFHCLCSSKHPIIICFNDLQWSDESSLQLIRALVSDPNAKHLMIIGAYRDDGMDQRLLDTYLLRTNDNQSISTSFNACVGSTSFGYQIGMVDIPLQNLTLDVVNTIVAELCLKETSTTLELSRAVYSKTDGNPYFVLQYMELLFSQGALKLNKLTQELDYSLPDILGRADSADNLLTVLAQKIKLLPEQVQAVLHLASYLGHSFPLDVLELIGAKEIPTLAVTTSVLYRERIVSALGTGLREGLLEEQDEKVYRFAHDSIRESLYSITKSRKDQELLHLRIGRILLDFSKNSKTVDETVLFLAIDNLNRGAAHITLLDEREDLLYLNMEAAKKSGKKAASYKTVEYLRTGISLLDDDKWERHYDLCLAMYSMAAEFEHNTGNFVRSNIMIGEVHRCAKSLEERIPVFLTEVATRGTRGDVGGAIGLGTSILRKLGEPFPKAPNRISVLREFLRTKRALKNRTDDELLALPIMTDATKLAAMKLLASLSVHAFLWGDRGKELFAVALLRMARLTCTFGLCSQSPQGFVGYGIVLCSSILKKTARRFGDLATRMFAKLGAREVGCRTVTLRIVMLDVWRQPVQECIGPLLKQYHYGLAHGDVEFAYMAVHTHLVFQYMTGVHLDKVLKGCQIYIAEMEEFQLVNALWLALPFWQMVEKLRGNEPNPHKLCGEVFDYYNAALTEEPRGGNEQDAALAAIRVMELWLAYLFDDFAAMPSLIRGCLGQVGMYKGRHFGIITLHSNIAFAAIAMFRKTGKGRYKRKARSSTKIMTEWASSGVVCVRGNAAMLNALLLISSKACSRQVAETSLLEAIAILKSEGQTLRVGVLYERLVEIMLENEDNESAGRFLRLAIKAFDSVGAMSKVVFLRQEKYPSLIQKKRT